ncbi:MAG: hypothetical protein RIC90_00675 [Balneola sp.]
MKILLVRVFIAIYLLNLFGCSHSSAQQQNLIDGLLDKYKTYDLIALGEYHDSPEIYDFYNELISDPRFGKTVDVIVFEVANALHQPILDKYIFGGETSEEELRQVWIDATNSANQQGDSQLFLDFFRHIRSINNALDEDNKIRVLAGDPAFDWNKIKKREDLSLYISDRDRHYGELVIREILDKNKKGFLIMGGGHFYDSNYEPDEYSIVRKIREDFPDKLFVAQVRIDEVLHKVAKKIPALISTSHPVVGNLSSTNTSNSVKLKDEINAVVFLGEITRKAGEMYSKEDAYFKEFIRRKKINSTNPFEKDKPEKSDLNPHSIEREIKKILFDIADLALTSYHKQFEKDKSTVYINFDIPDSFQKPDKGISFSLSKNDETPDRMRLFGKWIDPDEDIVKVLIRVEISKFDDFAILEIKRNY